MGCATSKIDDLPAVILCKERLDFLNQALHQRYLLSDCHVSYIHSLTSIGVSLHRFFQSAATLPPPIVTKTPHNDVAHRRSSSSSSGGHISLSNSPSGSHLHFHSDSDHDHDHLNGHIQDLSDSDSEIHSPRKSNPNPNLNNNPYEGSGSGSNGAYPYSYPYPYPHPYQHPYVNNGNGKGNGNYMQMNYMKKHVTPSVRYEQRPVYPETIQQFGETSSSSNYNNTNYGNSYGYMNYGAETSKKAAPAAVVPPPPPPATSTWDFLNPFESIESNYPTAYNNNTPSSRDSREVREEEGIPELEDEDFDHFDKFGNEVVKEVVHGHKKVVLNDNHFEKPSSSGNGGRKSEVESIESDESDDDGIEVEKMGEYEVEVVEKKVVRDGGIKGENSGKGGAGGGYKSVFEVVKEIQVQFERAAACGDQIAKVLEVGKLRYNRKNTAFQVSTKMLNVITPSLPSTSKDSETSVNVDEDVHLRTLNLSASLQKLYLWEKKLYEEVKAEEKMRVSHDKKVRKLKHLEERGAEPQKIESTRSVVRGLSTKITIAIQIVDRISAKINKVRDEELWPQLTELIQGLSRMWKAMLECHHNQCQAIDGARGLDAIAFPNNPSDTHLEATLQLEQDLINWTCRFMEWVGAQKGYVRALNGWLLKCLLYEPEETADGIAPFSPGRAGAPPIFVICNQWNQSMERISETSEKEVINSMRVFAMVVWHFRERDKGEMKQRMTANRDIERMVKNLDREDIKIQKEIQALDKKMELTSGTSDGLSLSGNVVYQSDTSSKTSLQAGLRHIFEALERFTADSVKAYEDLLQRTEEVVRKHGAVS